MLRTVHLHGALKKFSKEPILIDASTTQLLVRGLTSMLGMKFKEAIREGSFHIFKGAREAKEDIGQDEISMLLGKTAVLHIYPVIKAAGAIARIIIGVALIAVGTFFPALAPYVYGAGASMILGGVAELLSPKPKTSGPASQQAVNPSFIFNGTVNVTEQGGPPPIIYGRMQRASSLVLSVGLTVENIAL